MTIFCGLAFVPELGTLEPNMRTDLAADRLVSALFPKSRRVVLGLLMSHPDQAFYLREIAEIGILGMGHLQRELKRLVEAGVVRRFKRGRHVYFQANPSCAIYDELRGIVLKTLGAAEVLRQALLPLRDRIRFAFIFGSVARQEENSASDLDLMVVGEVSLGEVVHAIRDAEQTVGRPVNPTVYPFEEFSAKLAARHHFLTKVVERDKLMLIGDERDVRALSGQ